MEKEKYQKDPEEFDAPFQPKINNKKSLLEKIGRGPQDDHNF